MSFLNPIGITISLSAAAQTAPVFRLLIEGSSSTSIPVAIFGKASWQSDMLNAGYLATDLEYKMVGAHFSQNPCPADVAVFRKLSSIGFDAALSTLIAAFSDFWGVSITSTLSTDQSAAANWVQQRGWGVFIGRLNSASQSGARGRVAWINCDHLQTAGYQSISSGPTPFVGSAVPAIPVGTYDLQVQIDGGTNHSLAITIAVTDSWAVIAGKIQIALQVATSETQTCVIDAFGNITITSSTTGRSSAVIIQDGAASGLIAEINAIIGYGATILSAVAGTEEYTDAAWFGRKLPEGYLTWAFKVLAGCINSNYSTTQLNQMLTNKLNWIQQQNGIDYTYPGKCEDGGFIDTNYFIDYLQSQLQIAILGVLLNNEAVPFDGKGFGLIESAMRTVFTQFGKLGTIKIPSTQADLEKSDLGDFMYQIGMPAPDEVNANDELNRLLSGITATVQGSGAVHGVSITISIVE